ncbi:hypothetical protein [Enterococcus rotai]|uniref:hypothetical protein n=1 Tax=Enterococcus rotai TaxID=118060 RepID=UPI0035C73389
MKNTIILEIKRESAKELFVTELSQIEEHLAQAVEKFTEKIEQEDDGNTRKMIRSKRKVQKKSENYFMTSKKTRLSKI